MIAGTASKVPCDVDFNIGITDVVSSLNAFQDGDYEEVYGSGHCGPTGLCLGGPDHNQPCTTDDCSSDPCGFGP